MTRHSTNPVTELRMRYLGVLKLLEECSPHVAQRDPELHECIANAMEEACDDGTLQCRRVADRLCIEVVNQPVIQGDPNAVTITTTLHRGLTECATKSDTFTMEVDADGDYGPDFLYFRVVGPRLLTLDEVGLLQSAVTGHNCAPSKSATEHTIVLTAGSVTNNGMPPYYTNWRIAKPAAYTA